MMKVLSRALIGADFTITLPPGRYIVVDPCYVLDDKTYQEQSEHIFRSNREQYNLLLEYDTTDGQKAVMLLWATLIGDGTFPFVCDETVPGNRQSDSLSLPVDSGSLAVIDKRLISRHNYSAGDLLDMSGEIVLNQPTMASVDKNGNMSVVGSCGVTVTPDEDEDSDQYDCDDD